MISFRQKGDFSRTNSFLEKVKEVFSVGELDKYGREGVAVLREATPRDTGKTADSWDYEIVRKDSSVSIIWTNSNLNEGYNIALLIQYGHGTGNGYHIQGIDYINPAMRPVFDNIAEEAWKEVTKL